MNTLRVAQRVPAAERKGRAAAIVERQSGAQYWKPGRLGTLGPAGNRAISRAISALALQRQVDATNQSMTASTAQAMTNAEILTQLRRLDAVAGQPLPDAERRVAEENLRLLEAERVRRTNEQYRAAVAGDVRPAVPAIPRPPGIPLSEGVQLIPILDLPPGVAEQLPEGQIYEPPSDSDFAGGVVGRVTQTIGAASAGAILAGNYQVGTYGFAAAGQDAFGIVAIPRTQPIFRGGGFNPQANPFVDLARPLDSWGHTAMYVRRGGRIEWVRGFGPDMSPGQLPGFIRQAPAVESGAGRWPGVVENDASMFRSTMARTVEYPVSPQLASQIAGAHPEGAGGIGGSPTNYTARPATFAGDNSGLVCSNTNCVGYAVRAGEQHLGGPIGRVGQGSIADIGVGGRVAPNPAGQGQLYGMIGDAEAAQASGVGPRLSVPPNASGPPVAASMPRSLRYLKWGGRVFLVVGVVLGGAEIFQAPKDQRLRTAAGVTGGFAGGLALGATAGLICGPGAVVCSVVLGLGLGILGSVAGRSLAEHLYDADGGGTTPGPVPMPPEAENRAAHNGVLCPSCHEPMSVLRSRSTSLTESSILGTVLSQTGRGALAGREGALSADDLRILRQWLGGSTPPRDQ